MPAESGRPIMCKWSDGVEYPFVVDEQLVCSDGDEGKVRMKDVYLGVFRGDRCPPGVEPGVRYCLKIINTDPDSLVHKKGLVIPSTREQYDLCQFRGEHFRSYLAWNDETQTILEDLKESPICTPLRNCCVVEPVYQVLGGSGTNSGRYTAMIFEEMTPWERMEYMRQIIEALLELQEVKNRVAGRCILAHRDIKVDNALIDRDYASFRVILLDMASILFDSEPDLLWKSDDVAQVSMGAGPHATCNGILSSPSNTPPEQVFEGWPQSEKIDVFALGGILASLFGTCMHSGVCGNRNPIWEFHDIHGWPRDGGNNENASSSAAGEHAVEMSLGKFCRRYEMNLDRDRSDPGAEIGWLEQDLKDHGVTFAWGKEPDGIYNIPEHILTRVQELFRRCTRIDPGKRISLRELFREITELTESIPESRNYQNQRLYLAKEMVHLYDLNGTDQRNLSYGIYTRQAAGMSRRAIRCATFNGVGEYHRPEGDEYGKIFRNMDKLADYVTALRPVRQSDSINVTHAFINLYRFYAKYRSEVRFDGEIRIFTNGSHVENIWDDYGPFSVTEVLSDLEQLLGINVKVRVYCPEDCMLPALPDERFHWQRTTSFGGNNSRSGTSAGKNRETRIPEKPKPEPQPVTRVEDSYICGEEGLYFLYKNKKVYVSKRRR